jgi:hypothetical protein
MMGICLTLAKAKLKISLTVANMTSSRLIHGIMQNITRTKEAGRPYFSHDIQQ